MQLIVYPKKNSETKDSQNGHACRLYTCTCWHVNLAPEKRDQRFKARILMQHQLDLCPACTSGVEPGTLRAQRSDARRGASRAGPWRPRAGSREATRASPPRTSPYSLEPGRGTPPPPDRALAPVAHPARGPGARGSEWARGATGYVAQGGFGGRWFGVLD